MRGWCARENRPTGPSSRSSSCRITPGSWQGSSIPSSRAGRTGHSRCSATSSARPSPTRARGSWIWSRTPELPAESAGALRSVDDCPARLLPRAPNCHPLTRIEAFERHERQQAEDVRPEHDPDTRVRHKMEYDDNAEHYESDSSRSEEQRGQEFKGDQRELTKLQYRGVANKRFCEEGAPPDDGSEESRTGRPVEASESNFGQHRSEVSDHNCDLDRTDGESCRLIGLGVSPPSRSGRREHRKRNEERHAIVVDFPV